MGLLADSEPETNLTGRCDVNPDGGEFLDVQTDEPVTDWTEIFKRFNLDPDVFVVVDDTVRMSSWQQSKRTESGDRDIVWLYSYSARFTRKMVANEVDLPALYAAAEKSSRRPTRKPASRATVIVYADPQVGKTGRRGGTAELIERSTIIRHKLEEHLAGKVLSRVLLADAGDGIEGFESGGNPMFTNDLSLAGQLDTYGTELFKFIDVAHKYAPVTVAGIPSNHAAWRCGKQNLGKPSDDLGLFMHKQVQNRTEDRGMDVEWIRPDDYDESVAFDLHGTRIGLVHGNQFGPGQAVQWWQKQAFGAQASATADILVHGHYHTFSANVAGRNPKTDKQRWCLGAPTLDNGSDWFRTVQGRDSDPGLMVFDITEDGFDLASLTIISA